MRNFPSTDKWSTSPSPSSFSIDFRTFQRKGSEGNLEGNLNLSKITRRLVDLSIVTQTRDGGIKGGWYDVVKRDDRGTGYSYVVNPCLPKNRSIYRHREIFQDLPYPLPIASKSWCNLGQALLAYPTFYSNRAYYSTRVARILASSQREEQRERKEARGRIDARYEKFQKADSEKRVGRGMEKDPGSASEFEASRIARKAKLVGGNLSRVRIHLNPPSLPPSGSRDSSFESLAEKDLVWPSVKNVWKERARGEARKLEASMPGWPPPTWTLSRHGSTR